MLRDGIGRVVMKSEEEGKKKKGSGRRRRGQVYTFTSSKQFSLQRRTYLSITRGIFLSMCRPDPMTDLPQRFHP
jgi:hypothetical protein